jgi:hypothetical protein
MKSTSPAALALACLGFGAGWLGLGQSALAQDVQAGVQAGVEIGADVAPAPAAQEQEPIPPNVQGAPIPVAGGGYCYGGPHPAPGGGWEAVQTPHVHNYAPFDMRLFSYHDGCYYFIGDPRDFGYTGAAYSYYGAHPIADVYGGGWCFMVGPHYHWWRPWSPYFTVVGPWYYWYGPYDPFFWAYWPYYSFYYRSYYPSYYAGGRYYRNGYRAAPPITHVPPTAGWRGTAAGAPPPGGWRGTPAGAPSAGTAGAWRGGAPGTQAAPIRATPAPGGWRGPATGGTPGGAWHAPAGGAWHPPAGGAWHPPAGGGWHPPAGGGWHAPSGGGFQAPSGGGWHGSSVPHFGGGGGGGFHFHGRH